MGKKEPLHSEGSFVLEDSYIIGFSFFWWERLHLVATPAFSWSSWLWPMQAAVEFLAEVPTVV
jgi:hypothetical protein